MGRPTQFPGMTLDATSLFETGYFSATIPGDWFFRGGEVLHCLPAQPGLPAKPRQLLLPAVQIDWGDYDRLAVRRVHRNGGRDLPCHRLPCGTRGAAGSVPGGVNRVRPGWRFRADRPIGRRLRLRFPGSDRNLGGEGFRSSRTVVARASRRRARLSPGLSPLACRAPRRYAAAAAYSLRRFTMRPYIGAASVPLPWRRH